MRGAVDGSNTPDPLAVTPAPTSRFRRVVRMATVLVWVIVAILIVRRPNLLTSLKASAGASTASTPISGPIHVIPSTVILEQLSANGSVAVRNTNAVRSDGASVLVVESYRPGFSMMGREIRSTSGETIVTDETRGWKARGVAHSDPRVLIRTPESRCLNTLAGAIARVGETLESEITVEGRRAFVLKTAAQTEYRAPDLNCAVIGRNVGTDRWRVRSIQTGEPAASLFDIPPTYRLVSPARMQKPFGE